MRTVHLLAAAAVLLTGCEASQGGQEPSQAPPSPTAPAGPLPVAVEDTGAHYDRKKDWGDWTTRGGCTTREKVLFEQGDKVTTGAGCDILSGSWVSPYDDQVLTDPGLVEIDHVVPPKEVTQSGQIVDGQRVGPRTWTRAQRVTFYNDEENLLAVPARLNEQKGAKDPAQWLPPEGRCGYVQTWVQIKRKYELSADQAELDAIARVQAGCKG